MTGSVDETTDKRKNTRRHREKFVKLNYDAMAELAYRSTVVVPLVELGGQARRTVTIVPQLLLEADYRTGALVGSDVQLAAALGLARGTWTAYMKCLEYMSVIEGAPGSRRIKTEAWDWLTRGGERPPDLVTQWLFGGGVDSLQDAEAAQPLSSGCATIEQAHAEAAQPLSSGCATIEQAHAVSPGETAPQDCKDKNEDNPKTDAGLLAELDLLVPGCRGDERVGKEITRIQPLGWSDADIAAHVETFAGEADAPGLVVYKLRLITGPPARVRREQQVARGRSQRAAPDCQHGTPNGTWNAGGAHGPDWRLCALCRVMETVAS